MSCKAASLQTCCAYLPDQRGWLGLAHCCMVSRQRPSCLCLASAPAVIVCPDKASSCPALHTCTNVPALASTLAARPAALHLN